MGIFYCYLSLPEGISHVIILDLQPQPFVWRSSTSPKPQTLRLQRAAATGPVVAGAAVWDTQGEEETAVCLRVKIKKVNKENGYMIRGLVLDQE